MVSKERIPIGTRLSVASEFFDPPGPIASGGITNAKDPVLTVTGISRSQLAAGDIVVILNDWHGVSERAYKLGSNMKLTGIDTTPVEKYPPASAAGEAMKVKTWLNILRVLNITTSGGEQQYTNYQFLEEDYERSLPTHRTAFQMQFPVAYIPDDPAQIFLDQATEQRMQTVLKLTLPSGAIQLFYGHVTITAIPEFPSKTEPIQRTISFSANMRPTNYSKG